MTAKWRGRCLVAALGMLLPAMASVAAEPDERVRIANERAAVESAWSARERECATHFAVTACVEDAQRQRRIALAGLRRKELVLDEAQRRERAAARVQQLQVNAQQRSAAVPRVRDPQAPKMPKVPPTPREPRAAPVGPDAAVTEEPPSGAPGLDDPAAPLPATPANEAASRRPDRRQEDARRAALFAARAEEARAHRESVARRNAELAAKGKTSRPLPVPAGASAP